MIICSGSTVNFYGFKDNLEKLYTLENFEDSIEYDYATNILPLPCDQRYGIDDMKRIIIEINNLTRRV